ncbi:MAG: HPr family phosphocarrier protein [Evtepia gabavorous]
MYIKQATVNNQVGLHARPATFFIQKANEFKSTIWVRRTSRESTPKVCSVSSPGHHQGQHHRPHCRRTDEKDAGRPGGAH